MILRKVRHLWCVASMHLTLSWLVNGNPSQACGTTVLPPPSVPPSLLASSISGPGCVSACQPGVSGLDIKPVQKNVTSWKISSLFHVLIKAQLMRSPCHSRHHRVDRICPLDLPPFLSQNLRYEE